MTRIDNTFSKENEMYYFLENDEIIVKISSFGAEVQSVLRKENYREYLWYGDSKFWGRTSPVLFPFVGSLKNKEYTWAGKTYTMGQHGFARDMEFEFVDKKEDSISFVLKSDETTLAKYPFEFELYISYILKGDELIVDWNVKNPADETMYFSIGAHPAFLCPVHGEDSKEGYKLFFEGVDEIHHHGNTLDTGLAVMSEDLVLSLVDNKVEMTKDFFDRCTYMIENNQTKVVGIEDKAGKRIVDVCFDTPLFAIWSPEKKNAPFLCIEPWYGRCDATDFEGDLSKRDYTNVLAKGEEFHGGYSMKFYEV